MELLRALAVCAEPPHAATARVADTLGLPAPSAADHTDTFVFQLYPYASVYLGPEGMLGGEARDRIAGFLRTLGATPPAEPDHLTVLLTAAAELAACEAGASDADAAAAWRRSRTALLWEHLAAWVPLFADRVVAHGGPYAAWASLLLDTLRHEADTVGPAPALPLHLRAAPTLDDPRHDGAGFLDQLLAPVRTGVVLTRTDLTRAASDLGLGSRIGERRYVLSALLSQQPDAVLGWLAHEADRRATAHARHTSWAGTIATFWHDRALSTATLLRDLAGDAADAAARPSAVVTGGAWQT
jgi:TorA maturation chaperone TorD